MIRRSKLNKILQNKSTQTDVFIAQLDRTKTMRLYYSDSYKDYVLCLHFSNNKKYIITKSMWTKFKNHFQRIDNVLGR